ncbi:MAG: AEC family transporter, partial [Desulfurococcaceae archaeon TW002]
MVTEIVIMSGLIILALFINYLYSSRESYESLISFLTDVVYWVLIPLTFFKTFGERGLNISDLWILMSFLFFMSVVYVFVYKLHSFSEYGVREAVFLTSVFPNSVFLGFPISMAFFGTLEVASIFGFFTVTLNVVVPDFMSSEKPALSKLLKHPVTIGFFSGLALHYVFADYVAIVTDTLFWAGPLTSYSSALILGLRLPVRFSVFKKYLREAVFVGLFRFVLSPLVGLLSVFVFGIPWFKGLQLILVYSMPPALINIIMSQKHGWKPELVSAVTAVLTL